MAPSRSNHNASIEQGRAPVSIRDALKQIAIFITLTALYVATSKLGFTMAFVAEQVTVVWPPTGIALAAILLLGPRVWPAIALGAFLTNATAHEPGITALGIAAGNTLEALAGAWLLRRAGFNNSLNRTRDVLAFIVFAAIAGTMLSATIGATTLCLSGLQHWESYGRLWVTWWLGDAGGALVVAPFILAWARRFDSGADLRIAAEGALLAGGILLACVIVFMGPSVFGMPGQAFIYAIFPFLIWAALRFGQRGTTFITLAASAIAIWATLHDFGPFKVDSVNQSLMLLESFMAIVAITGLFLSATIAERQKAEKERSRTEERLSTELQAMTRLHALSTHLLAYEDLNSALDDVLDGAMQATRADFGNIQLYNPDLKGLEIISQRGFNQDFLDHFRLVTLDEGSACARAMQFGEQTMIEDVELDSAFEPHRKIAADSGFRAVQSIPFKSRTGAVLGMLSTHFRQPHRISSRDGQLLELYARHAADLIDRLRMIAQFQESDRRKNEFLATLAHELRNPLAPIRNALNVMRLSKNEPRRKEAQSLIERQLAQMVRLVDDLMDVSRITRGKIEMNKETVLLENVIASAVEMAQPLIEEHRQILKIELPSEPVLLNADPMRLAQVFANLLNNAAKYTNEGGTIEVKAAQEDGAIAISVRDNGIGIAKDMLPYIFDMFMQTDNALGRTQGGLGIGLTLVKNLVTLHGGNVSVKSDGPGKGSEFTVRLATLPMRKENPSPPRTEEQDNRAADAPALRILIVDDNKDSAQTLGWMMELLGHEFHIAHEGTVALALAERFPPDVILLDIGLPGMNGYDVCRIMKNNPALKNATFIAQTGWSQTEYIRRSKEAGFDHHLVKPVELEILRGIIENLPKPAGGPKAPPENKKPKNNKII